MVIAEPNIILHALIFSGNGLAALGAMFAIGISGIAAAYALQISGQSAIGATTENEKLFGKFLVLDLMPQTQLIYGALGAILIVLGIRRGDLTIEQGFICLSAGLAVGLTSISAVFQGMLAASSIGALARNEKIMGKLIIIIVMTEIAALFGLLVAFMMLNFGGIL
ncbi:MAG: V-type ATP synthase subunit K [Candidatus Altiarchaeota archaeon]